MKSTKTPVARAAACRNAGRAGRILMDAADICLETGYLLRAPHTSTTTPFCSWPTTRWSIALSGSPMK